MIGFEPGLHLHHDERLGGELELAGEREPKAWSAPRTWVAGEVLTASLLNVHLRDQLLYLGGVDQRLASPPGSPIDGQLWRYVADATGGVEWLAFYNSGDASAYKWHVIAGALISEVVAAEATASTAYVALSTPGPSITLARGGDYIVDTGFRAVPDNSGAWMAMSYDIGGTGAVDADACFTSFHTLGIANDFRRRPKLALAAATTLTAKYRMSTASSKSVMDRQMTATPRRIA